MEKVSNNDISLRFFFLVTAIGVIAMICVLMIRSRIDALTEDATIMNTAAHQSMLTQRVAKLAFIIQDEVHRDSVVQWRRDTLNQMLNDLQSTHEALLERSRTSQVDSNTRALIRSMSPLIKGTVDAGERLLADPVAASKAGVVREIERFDIPLTQNAQDILDSYRNHAQAKVGQARYVLELIGLTAFVIATFGIVGVWLPKYKRLRRSNQELQSMNARLHENVQEHQANKEQIRGSLEHINVLKLHLEDKERHYREVIENAGDLIYETDENGFCLYVNPSMVRLTGFDKSVLVGNPYWRIIHPAHRDRVTGLYQKEINAGEPNSYIEFPVVVQSGRIIWLGQNAHMTFQDDGTFVKASFIARDITELRAARQELEKTNKLFRLISAHSQDLITIYEVTGADVSCTYASPSVTKMLGYQPEDLEGKDPFRFVHPDDLPYIKGKVYPDIMRGASPVAQYRRVTKSGEYIWMESYTSPLYDEDGRQTGYQSTERDITVRREAERTLIEAKERAEEAAMAKSQFLSMMSHEIRTPMNGVIGLTSYLLEKNPRPDQLRHLQLLKFSGENLLVIINDILDFNKIEAGKINIEKIGIDLKSFIQNVVSTLEQRAEDKGIELILEYDNYLPAGVKSDPVRIHQVLNNLIGNAIKFTSKGSVQLTVEHLGIDEGLHEVLFTVRDSGIGIPNENLLKIFEPFSQGSVDTTRKFGGTGLGLAITRRLLNLMDSDLSVESVRGEGSTFSFNLLLEPAVVKAENRIVHQAGGLAVDGGANVLLVEDNDVNQIVAANYLELWKFNVTIAESGVEALKLIQLKIFHLVLMDIQMPIMNGYECTRQIRELPDPYFKDVPIIALTASATGEDIEKLGEIGLDDYVTKPFAPQELHDKIFRHFKHNLVTEAKGAPGKLNQYSNSNPSTNVVLAERMIGNLKFLQQALDMSITEENPEIFRRAHHQVKTTISIIADDEFSDFLDDLRKRLQSGERDARMSADIEMFKSRCEDKMSELSSFIMSMKA